MRAKLTVLHGANKGKTILIATPQYVVGRNEKCQLRLNHEAISRQHCAFLLAPDKIVLRDLGSRNGTLVNGEKITKPAEIKTGDQIQFGPLQFSVQVLDQAGKVVKARKTQPVAEVATGDSGIISDWLSGTEGPTPVKDDSTATTRMFKFDGPDSEKDEFADEKTQTIKDSDTTKIPPATKKKAPPGKLPASKKDIGENTQEAAAETLRRIFTRDS